VVDLKGAKVEELVRIGGVVGVGEDGGCEEEEEKELMEHGALGVVLSAVATKTDDESL
jgi:hypothetical protein